SYETIGGLIFSTLGHIPRLGEAIKVLDDITLVVTKMRGRQILKVKMIFPIPYDEDAEGDGE
ncbi:MAG TPA: HlyC/CorC family transporter, partial [Methanocorpusculum sp.]|nr:HlyC/CorC family transporter [Methanocorpusculum sp.]